jgi:EAL and modified HD-GYP domain-containing signal transduction protein
MLPIYPETPSALRQDAPMQLRHAAKMPQATGLLAQLWRSLLGLHQSKPEPARRFGAAAAPVDPAPAFAVTEGAPLAERFVVIRQAVLNRDMAVIGYEFTQTGQPASAEQQLERDRALLRHATSDDARALVGERAAFVAMGHKLLFDREVEALAGSGVLPLLRPDAAEKINDLHVDRIAALRRIGVRTALACGRAALENEALAAFAGAAFFNVSEFLPPDLLRVSRQLSRSHPALKLGVCGVETQDEFDACSRMNFAYFHGPFIRRRGEWSQSRADPGALRICDLLARLRKGAELAEIAEQIRLDPMISYRILRVANSAAVGASRDITSIRDATLIIGREPLYRWLVLLLCITAPATPAQQVLLESALARGRLMELLAAPAAPPDLRQLLFLTGLFSLLDLMLRVPMQTLLAQMNLPPEVGAAIIGQTGPCALPLQLAEACERDDDPLAMELCVEMRLSLGRLNQLQTAAGAWARASAQGIAA